MRLHQLNYKKNIIINSKLKILLFLLLTITAASYSQDGTLDAAFNSTGKVTTSFGTGYDQAKCLAIQSDGKIVAVGIYPHGSDDDFAVVRYLSDGTLDATFGSSGKVTTSIGSYNDAAYGVAIQSDGKIVVVGQTSDGTRNRIAVVRYSSAGVLDNTFDSDGIVTTWVGTSDNPAYCVAIQSDGKIIVAGYAHIGLTDDIAVVRYNTDGSLDTGFDSDGIVTTAIGSASDVGYSIAIQSNGKIVVAGYDGSGGSNNDFAVIRYNSDGSLDTGFDSDGIVTTAIGSASDVAYGVAIQSDGKIVAVGYAYISSTDDFAVVRYNTDGSLDTGFDTDGKVTTNFVSGYDWAYSLALQADGKIVVAGYANNSGNKIGVARYNSDGSLDTGFDTDGKVITAIGSNGDYGNCVALQSDGKIVVAGLSYVSGSDADLAVVRYSGSSGPMPVELISFTAIVNKDRVELNWSTATEVNNYGFEVERISFSLTNALKNWNKIGFVEGHGNSNSPKSYYFTDNLVSQSGKYIYRLKQIDTDGSYEFSRNVEADFGVVNKFELEQNYPNPFNPSTLINFSLAEAGYVTLKVYDILGKETAALIDNEWRESGNYNFKLSINNLNWESGIYFYKLETGGIVQIRKMALLK